jgi:tRNA pseudouridine13 synthase
MLPTFSLDFPYAYGQPNATADFRAQPEDFQVYEHLGFEPCGAGEHVYLQVSKRGENTAWVAEKIAALAQVLVAKIATQLLRNGLVFICQGWILNLIGLD